MTNQPRHHHFIPRFYLKGFTASGKKDGPLFVFDREEGRLWPSKPEKAAHIRDFHAVDAGTDRMFVEKKLADCEGKWAPILNTILQAKCLPEDEPLAELVAFVSFMAMRIPRVRNLISKFVDQSSRMEIQAKLSTVEGRQHFRSWLEQHLGTVSTEEQISIRQIFENDSDLNSFAIPSSNDTYKFTFGQTWDVKTMLSMSIRLIPILGRRYWTLHALTDDAPDLICSDSPVCLTWNFPTPHSFPPGFNNRDTLVTIPLGKRLALAAAFDPLPANKAFDPKEAANMNTRTLLYARQLFLPSNDFSWMMPGGQIGSVKDLMHTANGQ